VEAPAPLSICLLGGFQVAVRGRVVPADAWRQRRAAAIVKLLALSPSHRLHREQVIEALWPDLEMEAAANNLRVVLHRARRRLDATGAPPGRFLVRAGDDVVLSVADRVQVDVERFETAAARAWLSEHPGASREAVELYPGDLLPEDLYEEWAANRREGLRASYLTLLARLAQLHEQRAELGAAIAARQRLLLADPLDEPAHVALIRLFARTGETRQAATQYDRLVVMLETELGVEPESATRELMTAIRDGRYPTETRPFAPLAVEQPIAVAAEPLPEQSPGGLPAPLDDLIGREREIAELKRLMGTHRLVTLTGPAGVGKTRLAIAVAYAATEGPEDARFADLAPLRDPALVLPTIATALGVREAPDQALLETIATHLGAARALLVLDNFEQVVTAAPTVAEVLAHCPGLRVLVTSRSRLRVRGEQEYPVQPLAVPNRSDRAEEHADRMESAFPAVALFVQRAAEAQPGFVATDVDMGTIAEICRRLDGLPLAIELAAARVRVLPLPALLARLERPLAMLTAGLRDAPARQQTLRAAIAWSHDLLSQSEQTLFARLAVFAGGFTLEGAENVGEREGDERGTQGDAGTDQAGASSRRTSSTSSVPLSSPSRPPASPATLDLLASLVEQSLLQRVIGVDDTPRFALLETIRDYAREQLAASGETTVVRLRHAAFFRSLVEDAAAELTGPEAAGWLRRLDREQDNLRAALTTLDEAGDVAAALDLAAALWRFWWLRGRLSEGRGWLERLLGDEASAPENVRARAFAGAGSLAAAQGDFEQAIAWHAESLRLWRASGDREGIVRALTNLGLTADEQGHPRQAAEWLREALELARETGDRRSIAVALANLGQVALTLAEHERAAALFAESVSLFRALGSQRDEAAILANLGVLAFHMGDMARAAMCHAKALTLLRDLGDRQGEADELLNLGHTVQRQGDLERAAALIGEALARFEEIGDRSGEAFALNHLGRLDHLRGDHLTAETLLVQGLTLGEQIGDAVAVVEALEGLAALASDRRDAARGAMLLGAAETLRETIGVPLPEVHVAEQQRCLREVRQALGEVAFASARAEGRRLARDARSAVALGLSAGDRAARRGPTMPGQDQASEVR
jgi:predicted ATPase/DNA-binding SARP family transcriptional activator